MSIVGAGGELGKPGNIMPHRHAETTVVVEFNDVAAVRLRSPRATSPAC